MKLGNEKELITWLVSLHRKNEKKTKEEVWEQALARIDRYLYDRGWRIINEEMAKFIENMQKEKGTVSVKEVDPTPWRIINIERGGEFFSDFKGRLLYAHLVDANDRLLCSATLDYILNRFQSRKDIISNYQEAYDTLISFSKEIQKYWESNNRKPSADGEESLTGNAFRLNLDGIEQVVKRELSKALPSITFTPFQRCPVCEGVGEEPILTNLFPQFGKGYSIGYKDAPCHCCQGSGCIPMKRESR